MHERGVTNSKRVDNQHSPGDLKCRLSYLDKIFFLSERLLNLPPHGIARFLAATVSLDLNVVTGHSTMLYRVLLVRESNVACWC